MTTPTDTPEASRARIEALHAEIAYLIQYEKNRIDREQPELNSLHRHMAHCKWEVLEQSPQARGMLASDLHHHAEAIRRQYAD